MTKGDVIMFKKKREEEALKKIRDEIVSWRQDNPEFMVVGALSEIKKDKKLLEYYFPEVNWSKIDIDSIYNKLFDGDKNLNNETSQIPRRGKH